MSAPLSPGDSFLERGQTMVSVAATEAIRYKKAQYCRFLDLKVWASLEGLALPDATFVFLDPSGVIQRSGSVQFEYKCSADFVRDIQDVFKYAKTLHLIGSGELKQLRNGDVEAIWSMEDQISYSPLLGLFALEAKGGGYYYETWSLSEGEWKLKSLRLERTFMHMSIAARLLLPLSSCL